MLVDTQVPEPVVLQTAMTPVIEAVVALGAVGTSWKSDCAVVAVVLPVAVAVPAVVMPAHSVWAGVVPVCRVRMRAALRSRERRRSAGEEGSGEQRCQPCTRAETRENG